LADRCVGDSGGDGHAIANSLPGYLTRAFLGNAASAKSIGAAIDGFSALAGIGEPHVPGGIAQ